MTLLSSAERFCGRPSLAKSSSVNSDTFTYPQSLTRTTMTLSCARVMTRIYLPINRCLSSEDHAPWLPPPSRPFSGKLSSEKCVTLMVCVFVSSSMVAQKSVSTCLSHAGRAVVHERLTIFLARTRCTRS